jgi:hypothetical protein
MSDKHKESILPIDWFGWGGRFPQFYFYSVTFTEDFGVFKKGDECTDLKVNYEEGVVEEMLDGVLGRTQKFRCFPIPDDKID